MENMYSRGKREGLRETIQQERINYDFKAPFVVKNDDVESHIMNKLS